MSDASVEAFEVEAATRIQALHRGARDRRAVQSMRDGGRVVDTTRCVVPSLFASISFLTL